ncbi:type II toxin-antitoxin system RelE/ParE family toxin [Scytonema hofmannii FACHB-248]|uniref:Type II toxin-antitoxin system RelE/ParE family toxin n=1 Tax=Scytonema hofmannii FACHB-248 TaxID=1842502 RepID=A0ABR8GTC5_9CYAN|nr:MULTISPECIES: type II toxin-antitoxin system RelE/ParE family toxin [Nostocales]MBD2606186.1 type II toxin-antitoxin system RelE/ParE family toxin [Scytonema hofmannii FACHB-248]
MQIKWLRRALRNLEQAHNYILKDSPKAAQEAIFRIQSAVSQLENYPFMGRVGRVIAKFKFALFNKIQYFDFDKNLKLSYKNLHRIMPRLLIHF